MSDKNKKRKNNDRNNRSIGVLILISGLVIYLLKK